MYALFLNMADQEGALTGKSVKALKKKYPVYSGYNPYRYFTSNTVEEIDLIPLYRARRKLDFSSLGKILNVMISCGVADKILLGVHGHFDDVSCGYIGKFGERSEPVNFRDLAQFLLMFLTNRSERFNLSLIMCFGARSKRYLLHHEGHLEEQDVKSSFAYKFYKELCTQRHVFMTARTGAVSFAEHDGGSLVQSEAAVGADIEFETMQKAERTEVIAYQYKELYESHFLKEKNVNALNKMESAIHTEIEKGRTDWSSASGQQRVIIRYLTLKKEVGRLSAVKDKSLPKYGKFTYYSAPGSGRIKVYRKYPEVELLYRGKL